MERSDGSFSLRSRASDSTLLILPKTHNQRPDGGSSQVASRRSVMRYPLRHHSWASKHDNTVCTNLGWRTFGIANKLSRADLIAMATMDGSSVTPSRSRLSTPTAPSLRPDSTPYGMPLTGRRKWHGREPQCPCISQNRPGFRSVLSFWRVRAMSHRCPIEPMINREFRPGSSMDYHREIYARGLKSVCGIHQETA